MMASNLLSRLLPSASDEPYDNHTALPRQRRPSSSTDEQNTDIDEENLDVRFEAQDLEHLLADASSSQMTSESTAFFPQNTERAPPGINTTNRVAAWRRPPATQSALPDEDDDVPQSLLLEDGPGRPRLDGLPPPVPGPSTRLTREQWEATRRQQRLHDDARPSNNPVPWGQSRRPGYLSADPKEKALWLWVNQTDLDGFLVEVYDYYVGCGIYSILLRGFLMLLQTAFVVGFVAFLSWCIDYSMIKDSHRLSDVLVDKCMKK
jgi:autophagy-related protein 9